MTIVNRCDWVQGDEYNIEYHDKEWGVPVHDDKVLFKMLMLEGKQAGLSWNIILKRRKALCLAFDDFLPEKLIHYNEAKVEELMVTEGVIKSRQKINAVIHNAKVYYELCEKYGSLDNFLWSYIDNKPIVNSWKTIDQVPAKTELSDRISKDMKKLGFKYVGSVIVYAYMQGIGMVNDHLVSCDCYKRCIEVNKGK